MIVVVASVGLVIAAVPGAGMISVHVPVPVAAMVALPPGSTAQFTTWSVPASGLAVTVTIIVSAQPVALVHLIGYVPGVEKKVTVVVGEVVLVMVAVPDADDSSVHVPVPVPDRVVEPPGSVAQDTVLSAPALTPAVTTTRAVSRQAPLPHEKR